MPLLSFSTLGCPDWDFETIINFAAIHHYQGLEIRGIEREMDLMKCDIFNSPDQIKSSLKLMEEKGLEFVGLGSSVEMHHPEGAERQSNLEEGKRYIDLAQQLCCPYIRVFPNSFPKDRSKNATIDLIAHGLVELGDYARDSPVCVLLESHGEVVETADLKRIMETADHPQVGLVWDICNMWSVTKDPPWKVYSSLKNYIRHTHIKDLKMVNGKEEYTLLGQGDAPLFEAIDILYKGGYHDYYSFEWEWLWHPEIAAPEIALADYPKAMRRHFDF